MVPLHPTATAALRDYLRTRARLGPIDHSAPLFLDERSARLWATVPCAAHGSD